ncbi:hypothetical protein GCM10010191_12090 [Actinomadura vinacea]|uniref:Sigma-70 family RNA polymerase sigma factor n=1 Tax=Actinomadura vinacea TaxID=115336 RepID=A0ABN3IID7_9ACTN
MDDRRLVEALRARDPGAPAAVYDAYADRLYAYCWFQLRGRDAAQVALRDAFIVAEAHAGKLRDPDRLGAWLYAIARLECGRRLPGRLKKPDLPVASHDQDDVDQRVMAWQAVLGLDPLHRELLELRIRHRLPAADLASIVDLPPKEAQAELDRAEASLKVSLTAEMLAHQGPYGCSARGGLLRERRGDLDYALRDRLFRHAEQCAICGACLPRTISAAKVFGLLPRAGVPAELRVRVMSGFLDPELIGYRLFVATRVTDLGPGGFPVQPGGTPSRQGSSGRFRWRPARPRMRQGRPPSPVGKPRGARPTVNLPDELAGERARRRAAGRLAVGAVAAALLISGGAAVVRVLVPGLDRTGAVNTGSSPRPAAPSGVPRPSPTLPGRSGDVTGVPVSATFPLGALASSAPPTALPSPPGNVPAPGGVGGAAGPVRPGAGTLSIAPLFLDLADGSRGTVELRAAGGPVDWSVKAWGAVRPAATSGRLQAGQALRLEVHVTRSERSQGEGGLAFEPGGVPVRVSWRPAPEPPPSPTPTPPTPTGTAPSRPPNTPAPEPSSSSPPPSPSEPPPPTPSSPPEQEPGPDERTSPSGG